MMRKRIALISLAMITSGMMNIACATGAGGYVGFVAGVSDTQNKTQDVQLGTTPETTAPVTPTNTGLAGGFIIGYGFNPYAATEFGYTHYASSTYAKPEGSQLTHDSTINTNAIDIAVKGSFPFKMVSLFGKLGLIYASASSSGSLAPIGGGRAQNNNQLRPMYAIGASYDVTQNWVADVTYTAFTGGGGIQGATMLAVGVSYHFVDLMCGQFLC